MAKYELKIYGENDEIMKTYETNFIRWGFYMKAVEVQEEIKDKSTGEQFEAINQFIKKIFVGLTDEELALADGMDVMNTFKQILSFANVLKSSKNA